MTAAWHCSAGDNGIECFVGDNRARGPHANERVAPLNTSNAYICIHRMYMYIHTGTYLGFSGAQTCLGHVRRYLSVSFAKTDPRPKRSRRVTERSREKIVRYLRKRLLSTSCPSFLWPQLLLFYFYIVTTRPRRDKTRVQATHFLSSTTFSLLSLANASKNEASDRRDAKTISCNFFFYSFSRTESLRKKTNDADR